MRAMAPALTLALPFLLLANAAQAIEVQRTIEVAAPPAAVWDEVGGFCSIADWHPDVAGCTLEEDDLTTYRRVETPDGRTFTEQLMAREAATRFYSTSLVDSPWPVTGLVSEFQVAPGPDGTSVIVWQADFSTLAVDEDAAADELGELYQTGLEGIRALFDDA